MVINRTRAGSYRTNLHGEMEYRSFMPAKLPPDPPVVVDDEMGALLLEAHKNLSYLEGITSLIPDMNLFISMYVRKEALLSSQIEGTQATLEDIFDPDIENNHNLDVADVINYIKATEYAIARLSELPLCARLIRETHSVLMDGVRGQEKEPGSFRFTQNWIGGQGSTLRTAVYIPPNAEDMNNAISDLEKYMNEDDGSLDVLIRAALIHYQFETIHPFLDGNGRVGRLMITLYLMEQKVLKTPCLYLSYFLKANRIEYYDRMSEIRRSGDYEQWVKFFLRAFRDAAADAAVTVRELSVLHSKNQELISKEKRNGNLKRVFRYMEQNPILEIKKTADALDLAYNTVAKQVNWFISKGILIPADKKGKTRTFIYDAYLAILRRDTE